MHIHWKINRLDKGENTDPAENECLLEIEGIIECDGQAAGLVDAYYLYSDDPESEDTFMELWDLDSGTCNLFEEISLPGLEGFREPIPDFVSVMAGILCINFIALRPPFRRRGLGREVMSEVVSHFADERTGMVLLDVQPLQHRPHGYDHFDDEVRDLPWNSPEEDQNRLVRHFRSWGMQPVPGTRYLLAAPEFLTDNFAPDWFPSLLG